MSFKSFLFPIVVVTAIVALVVFAGQSPVARRPPPPLPRQATDLESAVQRVDDFFARQWRRSGLEPARRADPRQVLRRLSLALHGTVPSLEEIRAFEEDSGPRRLERWTGRLLADSRFADYFAERLARSFVGVDDGQFIVFRRDRFVGWLSDQLKANRPYDQLVRHLVAERGLWTGRPAANFVTVAVLEGDVDEDKLAGRTVRAFLGQRIDCAQCHDHPFAGWKQTQFEGLASFYGQTKFGIGGVEDKRREDGRAVEYEVDDLFSEETRTVAPSVPFGQQWLPDEGSRRARLAAWVTHPDNRRFPRSIANRVWGLLFGRPYHDPVDDLPDPDDSAHPGLRLLDLLATDFQKHGYDLKRLIHLIAASKPFHLSSSYAGGDARTIEELEAAWALFPLTRLRPEQVVGSMLQSSSLRTINQNSHLLVRFRRFVGENEFVKEYGDLGENELDEQAGTIPQALLRMNGKMVAETVAAKNPFNAAARIVAASDSDRRCLEICYLTCLTRRPMPSEAAHFLPQLDGTRGQQRNRAVEDILWAPLNSPEFSWNH